MAARTRKRKTPVPARARRVDVLGNIWVQSTAVFVGGIALGLLVLGPASEWAADAVMPMLARREEPAGDQVPQPAFGGTPEETVAASSAAATSAAPVMKADPLLRIRQNVVEAARGSISGADRPGHIVIGDAEAQRVLWEELAARGAALPAIETVPLGGRTLVAIFSGRKATGNHAIDATHAVLTDADLRVYVREMSPADGCPVTPASSSPYVFVLIDPTDLPVFVVRDEIEIGC